MNYFMHARQYRKFIEKNNINLEIFQRKFFWFFILFWEAIGYGALLIAILSFILTIIIGGESFYMFLFITMPAVWFFVIIFSYVSKKYTLLNNLLYENFLSKNVKVFYSDPANNIKNEIDMYDFDEIEKVFFKTNRFTFPGIVISSAYFAYIKGADGVVIPNLALNQCNLIKNIKKR